MTDDIEAMIFKDQFDEIEDLKIENEKLKTNNLVVLKNVRRLFNKTKNQKYCNWYLVSEIFGYGSTRSYKTCEFLNIDPEGYDFDEESKDIN